MRKKRERNAINHILAHLSRGSSWGLNNNHWLHWKYSSPKCFGVMLSQGDFDCGASSQDDFIQNYFLSNFPQRLHFLWGWLHFELFPLNVSISSQPGLQAGTIKVTLWWVVLMICLTRWLCRDWWSHIVIAVLGSFHGDSLNIRDGDVSVISRLRLLPIFGTEPPPGFWFRPRGIDVLNSCLWRTQRQNSHPNKKGTYIIGQCIVE